MSLASSCPSLTVPSIHSFKYASLFWKCFWNKIKSKYIQICSVLETCWSSACLGCQFVWEHTCRAGNKTPFSSQTCITDLSNLQQNPPSSLRGIHEYHSAHPVSNDADRAPRSELVTRCVTLQTTPVERYVISRNEAGRISRQTGLHYNVNQLRMMSADVLPLQLLSICIWRKIFFLFFFFFYNKEVFEWTGI